MESRLERREEVELDHCKAIQMPQQEGTRPTPVKVDLRRRKPSLTCTLRATLEEHEHEREQEPPGAWSLDCRQDTSLK